MNIEAIRARFPALQRTHDGLRTTEKDDAPVTMAWLLTALVYLQILADAVMRHLGAGLAIPDSPLSFGRLMPDFTTRTNC